MKYILIDKVIGYEAGQHLEAVKGVSLAEEYLGDHFPRFPVLPGVLLLQGLIESASWLVRLTQGFSHSMVLLEQARNVRYKNFLAPGDQIRYHVQVKTLQDNISSFTGSGLVQDKPIVEARLALRHFNLADRSDAQAATDAQIIASMKQRWQLLNRP